jgi:hypothetical protein
VRIIRILAKYNLIFYQNKFTAALENFNKMEKNSNLLFKTFQIKRIADKLINIYIIIKNVVSSFFIFFISLLLFINIIIVPRQHRAKYEGDIRIR